MIRRATPGPTPREQEVLACRLRGLTQPQTAKELDMTVNTVKKHMASLIEKGLVLAETNGRNPIVPRLRQDQILVELFARQGYIVINWDEDVPIGHVFPGGNTHLGKQLTPIRVTARSNRTEWNHQQKLTEDILGPWPRGAYLEPYFYRVEALD